MIGTSPRPGYSWVFIKVTTNEPGLYEIGNFGVRIEDDVLITDDGCTSLTTFPKELMVLPC